MEIATVHGHERGEEGIKWRYFKGEKKMMMKKKMV